MGRNMAMVGLSSWLMFLFMAVIATANEEPKNVNGGPLKVCSLKPMTGYMRDGTCRTIPEDGGTHVVCAVMTQEFLEYTKSKGNDLSTPDARFNFPGLQPGDRWFCALSGGARLGWRGRRPRSIPKRLSR